GLRRRDTGAGGGGHRRRAGVGGEGRNRARVSGTDTVGGVSLERVWCASRETDGVHGENAGRAAGGEFGDSGAADDWIGVLRSNGKDHAAFGDRRVAVAGHI